VQRIRVQPEPASSPSAGKATHFLDELAITTTVIVSFVVSTEDAQAGALENIFRCTISNQNIEGPQIQVDEEMAYLEGDKLWCYFVVQSQLVREEGELLVLAAVELDEVPASDHYEIDLQPLELVLVPAQATQEHSLLKQKVESDLQQMDAGSLTKWLHSLAPFGHAWFEHREGESELLIFEREAGGGDARPAAERGVRIPSATSTVRVF